MTNFEKYKDEILKIIESDERPARVNGKFCECRGTDCNECELLNYGDKGCVSNFIKWLYKESTATLTPKERAFCEMFDDKQRTYISRNAYGNLCVEWCELKIWIDKTLFPFIECKTRMCVAGLLKLEVCDE